MRVTKLKMPRSHLTYGTERPFLYPEFLRRKVARFVQLSWDEFLVLPGPEQSKHVAFYNMSMVEERLLAGGLHGG